MQKEWDLIEYPHCKGAKPRDPTHYINDLKMEELADLLWIGGVLANKAPAGFKKAWGHLQPALVHYLYGFEATEHDIRTASNNLYKYAELIETHVQAGEVCHDILSQLSHLDFVSAVP